MPELTYTTYIGASILAGVVGILTGIFGVGGGFIMTPALIILLGIPGNIAVGTSLPIIFINSSYGLFKRKGSGTVDTKLGLTMAGGSVLGVLAGVGIVNLLKGMEPVEILGRPQDPLQYILLCLFLLLLICIAGYLIYDLKRNSKNLTENQKGLLSKISIQPCMHYTSLGDVKISVPLIVLLGCFVGILTGLLGVGGGVVMLPALVYLIGQRTVCAAGTSLLIVWVASSIGTAGHLINGNVEVILLAVMAVLGIAGTNIGTTLGLKMKGHKIRFYYVLVVMLAVTMVAYKLISLTFKS